MAATDQPQREENPCQQGAVHTWHFSDERCPAEDVRCWLNTFHTFAGTSAGTKPIADRLLAAQLSREATIVTSCAIADEVSAPGVNW